MSSFRTNRSILLQQVVILRKMVNQDTPRIMFGMNQMKTSSILCQHDNNDIFRKKHVRISFDEKFLTVANQYLEIIVTSSKGIVFDESVNHFLCPTYDHTKPKHTLNLRKHCIELPFNSIESFAIIYWFLFLSKEFATVVNCFICEIAKIFHRIQEGFVFSGCDHDCLLCE